MFAGKKSAQIREILISESAWEEMTCLFAPSLNAFSPASSLLIPQNYKKFFFGHLKADNGCLLSFGHPYC
ncbi:hypothetical protein KKZ85_16065 [Enterobacter hormaechei subsp. xiangfangensis]|nr:hypothetical protein [Enterobacter hormaechei subsp. xiangfangensis]